MIMDITNRFIICHINRKNMKESNAGVLYIEKKLKAECVSMSLNSLILPVLRLQFYVVYINNWRVYPM